MEFHFLLFLSVVGIFTQSNAQTFFKKPMTYIAGPNQLTYLMDDHAFRFGYSDNNQFRVERRHANGTLEGYYGYIGADNKPVRIKYTSTDDRGYVAETQVIPLEFPETDLATGLENQPKPPPGAENSKDTIHAPFPNKETVSDDTDAISVDAAHFPDIQSRTFTYPRIELPNLRQVRSPQESTFSVISNNNPKPVSFTSMSDEPLVEKLLKTLKKKSSKSKPGFRRLVVEQYPGEPPIIYSDLSSDSILLTAHAQYQVE